MTKKNRVEILTVIVFADAESPIEEVANISFLNILCLIKRNLSRSISPFFLGGANKDCVSFDLKKKKNRVSCHGYQTCLFLQVKVLSMFVKFILRQIKSINHMKMLSNIDIMFV